MKHRRRLGLAALGLAIVISLTGCVSWFLPPTATSSPTSETVPADLKPFYRQVLTWTGCSNNLQCSKAKVPLDWSNPTGKTITLALIRQKATDGHSLGSLLVNPGGPGASGYDFIRDSLGYAVDKKLAASYDIVGFDPRGVNHSTAVSCHSSNQQLTDFIYDIPAGVRGSDEWIANQADVYKRLGAACLKNTGDLLGHVDTISAAKDMDVLRAALGDSTLHYLGYSYGTLLGQNYAELFPTKVGRMVLDGVVDPTLDFSEGSLGQAEGFEGSFRAFLKECPQLKDCPFTDGVDAGEAEVQRLLQSLDESPLRNKDGRELGMGAMSTAIIYPLYSVDNWPALVTLFNSVLKGDPSYAFQLSDGYYERNSDGSFIDNSYEAFDAINCLDYKLEPNVAAMRAQADELNRVAPVFGPILAYSDVSCTGWPVPATGTRDALHADGSGPILVLGTTGDPATPYKNSVAVAKSLQNGHLVTYNGDGHTAYNKSNSCVNNAVDNYLLKGTVPATDPNC